MRGALDVARLLATGRPTRSYTTLRAVTQLLVLALTAAILHNWHTGNPGRHLTAYDH